MGFIDGSTVDTMNGDRMATATLSRTISRRRAGLIAAALTLAGALGTVIATGTPASAAAASDFQLHRTAYSPLIASLDALLPKATVADVLDSANRVGSRCYPAMNNLVIAFCWNSDDANTSYWTPQGISTSGDASDTGTVDGRTAILTSWYDSDGTGIDKGVRVTFVDYANTAAPEYRHVLLVEPTGTAAAPSFRPVAVHAGGIAWYGNYLYVADTNYGFRVFDMGHIWKVTATGATELIGRQSNGTYQAFNYLYAIPQAFRYTQSTTNSAAPLRFSTVSVARVLPTHSLAMAEWADDPDASGKRLARFDLSTDGLLASDADGIVRADDVQTISQRDIQGTALIGDRYFLSQDDGANARGNLGVYANGKVTWYNNHLPDGIPEAQSYWPGKDQLWSLTEYRGKRRVFSLRVSAY